MIRRNAYDELTVMERFAIDTLASGSTFADAGREIGRSAVTLRGAAVRAKQRLGAKSVHHAVAIYAVEKDRRERAS